MTDQMSDLREDSFLGGRLRITQPVQGYRAGADAVMLGAACPAQAGEDVLELGCGAGVASLCLAYRVAGVNIWGLERDMGYAELARQNVAANDLSVRIFCADLTRMPAELRMRSFDHVMANPPYFRSGTPSGHSSRQDARHEHTPLRDWLDTGLRRLRPGGVLTVIHLAERLDDILVALSGRAGAISVLPIAARPLREAGRIIVTARKGARSPLRLLAPFIMHEKMAHHIDEADHSPQAQAVLRDGMPINLY